MSKYVDACNLLKSIRQYQKEYFDKTVCDRLNIPYGYIPLSVFEDMIKKKAVDGNDIAVNVPHGEWILKEYQQEDAWGTTNCFSSTCSVCGANKKTRKRYYCPECGADMGKNDIKVLIGAVRMMDE